MLVLGNSKNAHRLSTQGPADAEDRITTNVEQTAPGKLWLQANVYRIERLEWEREGACHAANRANAAAVEKLPQLGGAGMMRPHEAFHETDVFRSAEGYDFFRLSSRGRERLLAEDVLPSFRRLPSPFAVQGIGQWVIDSVDIRVIQQRFITAVGPGNACGRSRRPCPAQRAAGDGDQIAMRGPGKRRQQPIIDVGNAQNTPAKLLFHAPSL